MKIPVVLLSYSNPCGNFCGIIKEPQERVVIYHKNSCGSPVIPLIPVVFFVVFNDYHRNTTGHFRKGYGTSLLVLPHLQLIFSAGVASHT